MEKRARHAAPLVRLALPIDDQVDGDIETSQLPAEAPVLLTATPEIRLDDQQIQIAVRSSLTPCPRPEENDLGVGGSRGKATSSLFDQSLIGQRHNFRA